MPMSSSTNYAAVFACIAAISGCATQTPTLPPDLSPTPSLEAITAAPIGPCPLWIYRNQTWFKAGSFDFDLPVAYVNDVPVGKLRVGQTHCMNLKPGRYYVAVKQPDLVFPTRLLTGSVVEVKEGQSMFLRFAVEFGGGVTVIGTVVHLSTEKSLQRVTEQDWQQRR
jgi:hypothetical protein